MASFSAEEEAAHLRRLRRGTAADREAVFVALFTQLRERVFALCRNVLGNRDDAEEAAQECFLDVHRGLRGFRGEATLSTWVYRLAIHAALRTRRRRPAAAMALEEVGPAAGQAPAPDSVAAARQELLMVEKALARLSLERRTVLALFAIDGIGHEEIAEVLGVPVGTVWSRLHAARTQLRAAVGEGRRQASAAAPALGLVLLAVVCALAASASAQQVQTPRSEVPAETLTKPPEVVRGEPPAYPERAREQGLSADVGLKLSLDAQGKVTDIQISKSAGKDFDDAAIEAVRRYVFSPAQIDHAPAPVTFDYTLHFRAPKLVPPREAAEHEPPISLEGTVFEAGNRHPLAGVTVSVLDSAVGPVETDAAGHFALRLPPGLFTIQVFETNHQPLAAKESVRSGSKTEVAYYLKPKLVGLFETIVHGQTEPREVVRYTLDREELETTPGTFGDPLRVLQDLPGVARTPLSLGQLLVRGTGPNDTGTYLDGVEVPLLFHFLIGPSIVNPEFVDKLEFYPGGFGGEHGRAIGGMVDIETRKPDETGIHGSGSISLLDAAAYASAPITKDVVVAAAARRSFFDLILPVILNARGSPTQISPFYDDYQVQLDYRLPESRHRLQLFFFGSQDSLSLSNSTSSVSIGDAVDFWRLEAAWLYGGSRLSSKAQFWVGNNGSSSSFPGRTASESDLVFGGRERIELDVTRRLNLRAGADVLFTQVSNRLDAPPPSLDYQPLPGGAALPGAVPEAARFPRGDMAAWVEATLKLPAGFSLVPSLRGDAFYQVDHWLGAADPRLVLRDDFTLFGPTAIKASVGLYHEQAYPYEINPLVGNPNLPLQQALQTSLGVEHTFTDRVRAEINGFVSEDTSLAEAPTGLGAGSFLSTLLSGPFLGPAGGYVGDGILRTYGMEVYLRFLPSRHFDGWLSYTLAFSDLRNPQLPAGLGAGFHASPYDERHVINAVAQYRFNSGWKIGAHYQLASGLPYTAPVGGTFDADSHAFTEIPGPYNGNNLPFFQELDVRLDREWVFDKWSFGAFIDIRNVTNFQNTEAMVYGYNYKTSSTLTGLPILPLTGLQGRF